jgi:hypothetical protein
MGVVETLVMRLLTISTFPITVFSSLPLKIWTLFIKTVDCASDVIAVNSNSDTKKNFMIRFFSNEMFALCYHLSSETKFASVKSSA